MPDVHRVADPSKGGLSHQFGFTSVECRPPGSAIQFPVPYVLLTGHSPGGSLVVCAKEKNLMVPTLLTLPHVLAGNCIVSMSSARIVVCDTGNASQNVLVGITEELFGQF